MALKYSSKHDISYINYNNKNIPWQLNTTFISQNNQIINPSLNLGSINNNLLIESSQNNIVLRTPQNKKVFATNSMTVNDNLDVSNTLTTTEVVVEDICLNNILYLPSLPINIIGNLKVHGSISVINSTTTGTGLAVSKSEFINVTLTTSNFTDVSIVDCTISVSDFSNVNIINSYIYGIPIGYDKSNNSVPNEAIFSDISLENLILDSSLNSASFINFSNIIIKSSDDYSKLEISKPLNIELSNSVTNISNISVFNGDISCNILYYSQLFPDIRLNNYFDISIGQVSVSGNIIPSLNNTFNVGSSTNKFNTITSTLFIGDLSGRALLANDLVKNLDMSFNTLDVYGTITLNKKSLAQFVSGDLITIVAAEVSFNNVNNNVTDLSRLLYSKQGFDLCLNTNFAKRSLLESSFINLNNNITSIANNVYIKSDFDLCLNRNFIRTSDISAITSIVSSPSLIYPSLINLNSSLNKVVNASAVNELAFPYAITYIDDNVEDTNLKESYSYRKTTVNTTLNTTTTQTTTINYSYQMNSRPVSGAEPNNLGENRLTMWSANGGANDIYRRTWNDVDGQGAGPAVYGNFKTYTVDRTSNTWTWHRNNAMQVSGRRLAEVYSANDHAKIVTLLTQENLTGNDVWIGGVRIAFNTTDRTSSTWKWDSGAAWSYINWQGSEPGSNETHVRTNTIGWHDYDDHTTGMAIYMTGGSNAYQVATTTNANATGGTITTNGGYIIHSFTTSGTFRPSFSGSVEVLIVGGGGGGGPNLGGGGGGGAVIWIPATNVSANTNYSIAVGDGGASGTNGQNSYAFGAIAAGGGTSGSWPSGSGTAGGSGGGAPANDGTINQGGGVSNDSTLGSNSGFIYGNSGGNMLLGRTSSPTRAAGGGGAGPNGTGKALDTNSNVFGDTGQTGMGSGGVGYSSAILGQTYLWGGGGGGAGWDYQVGGYGGLGGGGGGAGNSGGGLGGGSALNAGTNGSLGPNTVGGNGGANTGGGGGGGNHSIGQGGTGGSGIVIIRYTPGILNLSWEDHRLNAISIGAELAVITNATENEAVGTAAQNAGLNTVYIGGRRTSNSTNAYGITSADWEWHNGTAWSYSNFFRGGQTEQFEVQTESSPIVSSPQTGQPVQVSSNTQNEDTNLSIVKLPLLVSSANGSIVATATAINVPSIPSNTSSNTSANPVLISDITTGPVVTRQSSITTNTKIHSYTTTNITYTLNNGLTSGSFNISNNSNNNSNYIKSTAAALPSTITTSYSCIAVTNDGMFVALGKANDVTVYMRNSTGWSALGSPIGVQFSAYTESSTGIIPTQFTDINWRKNLQNLAINYISGENQPRIFLAFGDTRNSVKIYSYDNGSWTFPNGFYSVSSGSWVLKHTHLASALGASNNFGYFVVLSHNPRILVFTIDDRFYSYNCSDSLFTARGSSAFIRLPTAVTNFTNIIALKISADADKVIVSNTHYVFVYKWNNASSSWTQVTVLNVAPLSQPSTVLQGTGGTITTSGGYIIHRFNTSGTFRPLTSSSVEVLIVGGGGGGGSNLGGGGGGGAVIWIPATNVTAETNYSIVVGDGGASGTNGQNSSAFGALAAGGGTSGSYDTGIGTAGGSGGGAAANGGTINQGGGVSNVSTLGTNSGFIYGNSGGNMLVGRSGGPTRAAGGGGAGPNGTGKALDTNSNTTGDTGRTGMGSGGVGYSSSILGPTYLWGGGGGGAGWDNQVGGYGGLGGGGGGSGLSGGGLGGGSALVDGSNGLVGGNSLGGNGGTNTGGGGGGGNHSSGQGGRGGSGIVVIRYLQTPNIAGPRSLDISNINTNNDDCVFAIGFPDKLITSRANNRSRGYVEYYQCLTSSPSAIITKLATLVPRKRDITNNNVDSDEYYFSIGGIKITNANTILVSPNYKFHFYSTTKNYEYNSTPRIWNDHSSNVITVAGRRMASIENELEQELVRINARNNQLWLGGRRRASSVNANGTTMLDWEWISPDSSWNYVNWGINQPDNVSEKRLHLVSNGSWNDLPETSALPAMYMTRSLSYSLNTFVIFDKFFFHSSGFFSSYFPTDVSNLVIARWATTDTPLNRSIEIRASGQIFSRSYGAISDIRLKENIVDVSPKLVDLLKVRVVNYNLKGCKDAKFIGVVAQELEQIFPALVKNGDLSPQDINLHKTETYKYVKYSCFDIMLIKAFQEQMDIINKLSFQVVELESKSKLLKTISQYNVILNEDLDFLKRENELLKQNINEILMLMAKC